MPSDSTESLLADSNVLVYAVDIAEQDKSRLSRELLRRMERAERGLVTSQLMTEFYAATTRVRGSRPAICIADEAAVWIERWLTAFAFRQITPAVIREAVRGAAEYQMHIYDAQVWACAKFGGAIILSEDGQSRDLIEGVRYINPFAADFTFESIGL